MEPELEGRPSAAISEGTGHPEGALFTKWTYFDGCRCKRCTASYKLSLRYVKEDADETPLDHYGRPYTGPLPHNPYLAARGEQCRCEGCRHDA